MGDGGAAGPGGDLDRDPGSRRPCSAPLQALRQPVGMLSCSGGMGPGQQAWPWMRGLAIYLWQFSAVHRRPAGPTRLGLCR